jgi:hypothetical protein
MQVSLSMGQYLSTWTISGLGDFYTDPAFKVGNGRARQPDNLVIDIRGNEKKEPLMAGEYEKMPYTGVSGA